MNSTSNLLTCDNYLVEEAGVKVTRRVLGILLVIFALTAALTYFEFRRSKKKISYPIRPVAYIACYQSIVATCFFVSLIAGSKIACNDHSDISASFTDMKAIRTITKGNMKLSCTIQALLLYFSQMISMFWWLIMNLTWFMIAQLKWAPEAVTHLDKSFHILTVLLAATMTTFLISSGSIEGDPSSNTCYVDLSDPQAVRIYVLYPVAACIMFSSIFLVVGFYGICESLGSFKRDYDNSTGIFYKLIFRILSFSLQFFIYAALYTHVLVHHKDFLDFWVQKRTSQEDDYYLPNYYPLFKYVPILMMTVLSCLNAYTIY